MLKIRHILFPIDFSDRCCQAVPFVESLAQRYKAKITLLSVAEGLYYISTAEPGGPLIINSDLVLSDLRAKLDGALTDRFAGIEVERIAMLGDPANLIVDYAHTAGVDLIMMPTHGYGSFRRFLLGSVTAKVLHDAKCPVWTSAHAIEPDHTNFLPYRSILCAIGGGAESAGIIRWGGEFAEDNGAKFRLVYVLQGTKDFPPDRYKEELREQAEQHINRLHEGLDFRAPSSVAFGFVGESVRAEALARAADLVIIGRGVIHETFGRLRTHAFGIIQESPCPVISI
jgi:nucleotide-binding universal stress UspA family protein